MKARLAFIFIFVCLFIACIVGLFFICSCEDDFDEDQLAEKLEPLKIRIVMFCTPNYYERGKDGVEFMKKYAAHHGYDFVLHEDRLMDDLHVNFTKMKIMEQETAREDVDFTVMSDADISGKRIDIPMENVIKASGTGENGVVLSMPKDVVHGARLFGKFYKFKQDEPYNSGFMIAKNGKQASEIFADWVSSARNECSEEANHHPNDQRVLKKCVLPKHGNKLSNSPWQVAGLPASLMYRHKFAGDRPEG